jgi:hypothetical protein
MRFFAVALIIGSLSYLASAQSCTSASCSTCASYSGLSCWCSNSRSISSSGCCSTNCNCPSSYQYQYPLYSSYTCSNYNSYPDTNPNYRLALSAGQIVYVHHAFLRCIFVTFEQLHRHSCRRLLPQHRRRHHLLQTERYPALRLHRHRRVLHVVGMVLPNPRRPPS